MSKCEDLSNVSSDSALIVIEICDMIQMKQCFTVSLSIRSILLNNR